MSDLEILARTVEGEGEGEPFDGKVAIAWTARNRLNRRSWYGRTIADVCQKPEQYSCWNEGAGGRISRITSVTLDEPSFRDSMAASAGVLLDMIADPTHGATHYHTKSVSPNWAKGREPCAVIGNHLFFNDIP